MTTDHINSRVETDQAGIKVCVWPKAYSYAAEVALDRAFNEEALNIAYRNCIRSNDVKVTKLVKPSLRIIVSGGRLIWMLDNVSICVRGRRMDQHRVVTYEKHVYGSLDIGITVVCPGSNSQDAIYDTSVNSTNLSYAFSSHGDGGHGPDLAAIFNGHTVNDPYSPTNQQSNSSKQEWNELMLDVKDVFLGNLPTLKRSRNDVRITSVGRDISKTSNGENLFITTSGGDVSTDSRGGNVLIKCSGGDVRSTSSGGNVFMKCCGGDIYTNSNSGNVLINSSGGDVRAKCSGGNVFIKSCGGNVFPSSTGGRIFSISSGGNVSTRASGSAIDDDLGETLIRTLMYAVLESLNRHLPVDSNHNWWFNFTGLSMPRFHNGYLRSTHLPCPILNLLQDVPFPEPQNSGRMLTIYISTCIINTVGSYFLLNDSLSFNLTQTDLLAHATRDNSGRRRFVMDLFPEISCKYPGSSMEVNLGATKAPTAVFSGKNLKVTLFGSAIFRARLLDGSLAELLNAETTMECNTMLDLNGGKVKGTVTSITPKAITVIKSALTSVNGKILREVFDMIVDQFLYRKFEDIAQKGILVPLPCGGHDLLNVDMSVADDFLRIDADIKFWS